MKRFFEVAFKKEEYSDGTDHFYRFKTETDKNGEESLVQWEVEKLPEYGTSTAAGADFFAVEETVIPSFWSYTAEYMKKKVLSVLGKEYDMEVNSKAFRPTLVHTGVKAFMPDDEYLLLANRSSGPKKGLVLANSVGVIDSDYYGSEQTDGEIMFAFYNFLPTPVIIHKGDAIGQGIFHKFLRAENAVVGGKRLGGFGSSDDKKK